MDERLKFYIPTLTWYKVTFFVPYTEKPPQTIQPVTSVHISWFLTGLPLWAHIRATFFVRLCIFVVSLPVLAGSAT
jgi:hypothetical protein